MSELYTVDEDLPRRVRSPSSTPQQVRPSATREALPSEDFGETASQLERSPSPPFQPHLMETLYPRQVQKHVNRKSLHMGRLLQSLRTPSKHACVKELRRMSELAKSQESSCKDLFAYSARKQKRLLCQERGLQSELLQKGIDIDDPALDVHKVFALPMRHKRYKQDPSQCTSHDPDTTPDPGPELELDHEPEHDHDHDHDHVHNHDHDHAHDNDNDNDTEPAHEPTRKLKQKQEEQARQWKWEPYVEAEEKQVEGMDRELKDPGSPEPKHVPKELTDSCYLLEAPDCHLQTEFASVSHFQIDDEPLSSFVPDADVIGLFKEIHNIRIDFPADRSKAPAAPPGLSHDKTIEEDLCEFAKENIPGLPDYFDYTVTHYEPPPFAKAFSQEYK